MLQQTALKFLARPFITNFDVSGTCHKVTTVDDMVYDRTGIVASYLLTSQKESENLKGTAAVVETNTSRALQFIEAAVLDEKITFEDIKFIIVTHIHLDHAAGTGVMLEKCPNATVICHPRASRHLIDPSKLIASAKTVYPDPKVFAAECGNMIPCDAARVRAVNDGEEIELAPGRTLKFVFTPGHAKHQMAVFDKATGSCFTGDAMGMSYDFLCEKHKLQRNTFFPISSPTEFDYADTMKSVNSICDLPGLTHLCPTHFGATTEIGAARKQMLEICPILGRAQDRAAVLMALFNEHNKNNSEGLTADALKIVCKQQDKHIARGMNDELAAIVGSHFTSRGLVGFGYPGIVAGQENTLPFEKRFQVDIEVNAMGLIVSAMKSADAQNSALEKLRSEGLAGFEKLFSNAPLIHNYNPIRYPTVTPSPAELSDGLIKEHWSFAKVATRLAIEPASALPSSVFGAVLEKGMNGSDILKWVAGTHEQAEALPQLTYGAKSHLQSLVKA